MRGGKRPGAGRPRGSKTKFTADARAAAEVVLKRHEPAIVARLLRSEDDRTVLEFWRTLRAYLSGKPREALSVSHTVSIEGVLEELARRRLGRATVEPKLLPSGDGDEGRER